MPTAGLPGAETSASGSVVVRSMAVPAEPASSDAGEEESLQPARATAAIREIMKGSC